MMDTVSESILSSVPIGTLSSKSKTTLHKRQRKTDQKNEIKYKRDRPYIADNVSEYSHDYCEPREGAS
jgi:hypothetical protein